MARICGLTKSSSRTTISPLSRSTNRTFSARKASMSAAVLREAVALSNWNFAMLSWMCAWAFSAWTSESCCCKSPVLLSYSVIYVVAEFNLSWDDCCRLLFRATWSCGIVEISDQMTPGNRLAGMNTVNIHMLTRLLGNSRQTSLGRFKVICQIGFQAPNWWSN